MADSKVVHITKDNWKTEVLESKIPVLVDFWGQQCHPCLMLAPILEELAGEVEGKLKIAKVDTGENQRLALDFQVRSIPTLLVFKGGVVQQQMVGYMNKVALKKKLADYL